MNRSYNVFVDNGLFVLAYHLNKDIEEITEKDVYDNIDMMCEKIIEFTGSSTKYRKEKGCEKYSKIKSSFMLNSGLNNPSMKTSYSEDLKQQTQNKGEEHCSLCGCNSVGYNDFSRKDIPNSVALAFYNFSNNLQFINVCNTCFLLTVYSILNTRKHGILYLYISDNNEFMYDYTYEIQNENKRDILTGAKEEKGSVEFNSITDLLNKNSIYDGYIKVYKFLSGKSQMLEVIDITSSNVKLLSKITKSGLLNEFKKYNLMYDLIRNKLKYTYLSKITDDKKILCSDELFEFLNKEVNILSENVINTIVEVANKLKDFDKVKLIKRLKLIKDFKGYESFLVEIAEEYQSKTDSMLYTVEQYLLLDSTLRYRQVKNLLTISLMQ